MQGKPKPGSLRRERWGCAEVEVFETREALGAAAAEAAAVALKEALAHGSARLIVATGNSQLETIANLTRKPGIEWSRVEVFHMDEYVGLPGGHPASFRRWIEEKLTKVAHPGRVNYLDGNAPDLAAECARYASLLRAADIHLCLLGIGENGHIAFNDPHEADFKDPLDVKLVTLDAACRRQQVGEGHFRSLEDVPTRALTLTVPALLRAERLIASVPERRKAEAVRKAIRGPLSPACPASVLRSHPQAAIALDLESASLL